MHYIAKNYLLLSNYIFSSDFLFIYFSFTFIIILYLFIFSTTIFFKILIVILFIIHSGIIISFLNADFFTGFLFAGEFPIILVLFLFYFHKYSLNFDNLYIVKNLKKNKILIFSFIFVLLCLIFYDFNKYFVLNKFFNFFLVNNFNQPFRNDFLVYYISYYILNLSFTILMGLLIFVVSYLSILVFFFNKQNQYLQEKTKQNFIFLRKQNLLKQGVYKNKIKFFKKRHL